MAQRKRSLESSSRGEESIRLEPSPMRRFQQLTRRLLSVPREELTEKRHEDERAHITERYKKEE